MENSNYKNGIKAILIGESGVGKTNLINVSVGLEFLEYTSSTYYNSFVEKIFIINNKKYTLHLWDTIGQEKFRPLTRIFFKDSKIVILVYDKTSKKSFAELKYWYDEVKKSLGDNIILAVVGNKEDLDEEEVDEYEAREYAKNINAKFRMASAKKNGKAFISFLKELLVEYINKYKADLDEYDDKIILDNESYNNNIKKKKCCE